MSNLVPMAVPLMVISLVNGKSRRFPLTPMTSMPPFLVALAAMEMYSSEGAKTIDESTCPMLRTKSFSCEDTTASAHAYHLCAAKLRKLNDHVAHASNAEDGQRLSR